MPTADIVAYLQYIHRIRPVYGEEALIPIVENEKQYMISNIVKELNRRTGDNFGDRPDEWSKKYGAGSTNTESSIPRTSQ